MEKFTYINEIDYDESITSESPFPEWIKTGNPYPRVSEYSYLNILALL